MKKLELVVAIANLIAADKIGGGNTECENAAREAYALELVEAMLQGDPILVYYNEKFGPIVINKSDYED